MMGMRMLPRKRFSLRLVVVVAVGLVLFWLFSSLLQFDEIESRASDERRAKLLKERLAAQQRLKDGGGGDEAAQREREPGLKAKFSNRYRFGTNNNNNDDALDPAIFADGTYVAASQSQTGNEDNLAQISRMHRLVHLDLKGSPPKLAYLKEFLPFIKSAGATGLVIEYDDYFPYANDVDSIRNQNHYTSSELKQLFALVKQSNFFLVPLVHSLNSLDFVLKLKQFAHLRESRDSFDLINPCLDETYDKVLFKMLDQVIDAHPDDIEYIHLGASKIREGLVNNPECKILNLSTIKDFYVYHLTKLVTHINAKRPNLKIMVWDDLLRKFLETEDDVNGSVHKLCKKIVPVVLNTHDYVDLSMKIFQRYDKLSDEYWIASAYKGTSHQLETIPNAKRHYQNHLSWLNLISRLDNPFKLKGIVMSGRSRIDHMQGVCETLPAAVPSLTLALQTIINYDQSELNIFKDTKSLTGCNFTKTLTGFLLDPAILFKHPFIDQHDLATVRDLYTCKFPGSDLYNWLLNLRLVTQYFEFKDAEFSNTLNPFNLKYKFFNPKLHDLAVNSFYPQVRARLKDLMSTGEKEFDRFFYGDLYEELTNLYILRHLDTIDARLVSLNKTSRPEFVPIRPLHQIEQTIL